MKPPAMNPYLRTKILTASPQQLRLMLYDGCIRFCEQARSALERQDHEAGYENFSRAQKIVLELQTSLNRSELPELCDKLAALYLYIYRQLVQAGMKRDSAALEEVIELLGYERETWALMMEKAAPQTAPGGQMPGDAKTPVMATLSRSA